MRRLEEAATRYLTLRKEALVTRQWLDLSKGSLASPVDVSNANANKGTLCLRSSLISCLAKVFTVSSFVKEVDDE